MKTRAPALPPEERRAAIIAAAVPLISVDGSGFTTRAVAEAAGIAEGTIFRIFPTKSDLLDAVVEEVLDPTSVCRELDALRPATLEEAISQAATLLIDVVNITSSFFAALHSRPDDNAHRSSDAQPSAGRRRPTASESSADKDEACTRDQQHTAHQRRAAQLHASLTALLLPFADQLRTTPETTASLLRSVVMACTHPFLSDGRITEVDEIVPALLHGCAKEKSCC